MGREGRVDAATIYDVLRREVRTGALTPLTPVREVAVAERFGVSRTPVREALRRLEHDRILTSSARGLVVRGVEADEVIATYNIRILLEGEAAAEAAWARTEADLLHLDALLDRDRELLDPPDAVRATTNDEFHLALWGATHNPVLVDLLQRLTVHLVRVPHSTLSTDGRWEEALDEHADLVAAVRDREPDRARAAAAAHMTRAREIRLDLLRRHGVSPVDPNRS